ncbi:SRPBCC family protein [Solirubrobacter deserti]|uniref:SRPBCC domain-containing protein n=1 Tax=Solirubrobacter deserti TaxID=2282478 RepID=A0ABT4RPE2_9ACTN|nr:SRPBCC family protein [Solirubrobacter deserti]MDA0140438.1 SRPBCC domain-containing protein [Solirubrobacter deserti]
MLTEAVEIDAPPEVVFEYFTRPELIVRWMGEWAELEPEPGGRFALDITGHPVRGRYVALEPPHRLVFTWGYAGSDDVPPGSTSVEVRLVAIDGGTRVELEHRGLPAAREREHHIGWQHYLARLARDDASPDPGMPSARGANSPLFAPDPPTPTRK